MAPISKCDPPCLDIRHVAAAVELLLAGRTVLIDGADLGLDHGGHGRLQTLVLDQQCKEDPEIESEADFRAGEMHLEM